MQLNAARSRLGAGFTMQLAPFGPLVRLYARPAFGVSGSLRMSSTHRAATTPYRRIRMTTPADAEVAYPLIATYLAHPELSNSVEEFVAQADGSARLTTGHDLGVHHSPLSVSERDHKSIHQHIHKLGLSPDTVRRMKGALDWWRWMATARRDSSTPLRYGRSVTSDEEERIYHEYASTASALLLSLCPNISTLHLGQIGRGPLEEYLLKSNYRQTRKPALQKLQHVQYYPSENSLYRDAYDEVEILEYLRYFHRLPRVSSVSVDAVMEYQAWRDVFPPKTSKGIKKMHFGHVDISADVLATVVRIPTALEELSVSIGGLFNPDGGSPMVDVGLLGRCLEQHKYTLKALDLDLGESLEFWMSSRIGGEPYPPEEIEFDEELRDDYFKLDERISDGPLHPADVRRPKGHDGTMMVFRDYTALKQLSINIEAIVNPTEPSLADGLCGRKQPRKSPLGLIDALPPSLEYLCLYGYRKGEVPEFDEQVKDLIARKAKRLPNLAEVRGLENVERIIDPDEVGDHDGVRSWRQPDPALDWLEA